MTIIKSNIFVIILENFLKVFKNILFSLHINQMKPLFRIFIKYLQSVIKPQTLLQQVSPWMKGKNTVTEYGWWALILKDKNRHIHRNKSSLMDPRCQIQPQQSGLTNPLYQRLPGRKHIRNLNGTSEIQNKFTRTAQPKQIILIQTRPQHFLPGNSQVWVSVSCVLTEKIVGKENYLKKKKQKPPNMMDPMIFLLPCIFLLFSSYFLHLCLFNNYYWALRILI